MLLGYYQFIQDGNELLRVINAVCARNPWWNTSWWDGLDKCKHAWRFMSPIMHFSLKALNNHLRPLLHVRIKGYRTELAAPTLTITIKTRTLLASGSKCIVSNPSWKPRSKDGRLPLVVVSAGPDKRSPGGVSKTFAISMSRVPADIGPISSFSTHGG